MTTVWIVSELYYPEETSTGYILTEIAEALAARGMDIRVICGQPTYAGRGTSAPRSEERGEVRIYRCRSTTRDKDLLSGRLLNMVTLSVAVFLNAVLRFKPRDIVMVVTNPPSLPFLVHAAAKIRRSKTILIVHDVYPELAIAAGMIRPDGSLARLLKALTTRLYRGASAITTLGRDMKELVEWKCPTAALKTVCIPNWADVDLVEPRERSSNGILSELRLEGQFIVQYAGNMGRPNAVEDVLGAAVLLQEQKNIHFLFIGSGAKRDWLIAAVETLGLKNVTVLPTKPREESAEFLNACDMGLVALVEGMLGVSVPSRIYNILAAGKPVAAITMEDSEAAMLIRESGAGWIVPPKNPEALAAVVLEASREGDRLEAMARRARRYAEVACTKQATVDKYEELVRNLG